MADYTFTLKDSTGGTIATVDQNTQLELDVSDKGDITYDTYTTAIDTIDVEVENAGPSTVAVEFTPDGTHTVAFDRVTQTSGSGSWSESGPGTNNEMTGTFDVPSSPSLPDNAWNAEDVGGTGTAVALRFKIKVKRKPNN